MEKKLIVDLAIFITVVFGILFVILWKNEKVGLILLLLSILISVSRKAIYDLFLRLYEKKK